MPKENIQWGNPYTVTTEPGKSWWRYDKMPYEGQKMDSDGKVEPLPENVVLSREPHLDVYWSRADEYAAPIGEDAHGAVQLLLDIDMADMLNTIKHIEKEAEAGAASYMMHTDSLTRSQINKLIRTLKRARDAAYGADE